MERGAGGREPGGGVSRSKVDGTVSREQVRWYARMGGSGEGDRGWRRASAARGQSVVLLRVLVNIVEYARLKA